MLGLIWCPPCSFVQFRGDGHVDRCLLEAVPRIDQFGFWRLELNLGTYAAPRFAEVSRARPHVVYNGGDF
jgi:hypothetical protein